MVEIEQFSCLSDNYGYLLHDPETNITCAIDTPDAAAILDALSRRGWRLTHILNTHHHFDHAGCNIALKDQTGCEIIGPAGEAGKIPGIDRAVDQGDIIHLGALTLHVLNVGGHTLGHIAYYLPDEKIAFVGDSLFALGCGRMFEGTPEQMWTSLSRLRDLPDDTLIYCAHEYTQSNAAFALSVDPQNAALQKRCAEIADLRAAGQPTVPSLLGLEKQTNPFLRPEDSQIQEQIGLIGGDPVTVFAEIRRLKDHF